MPVPSLADSLDKIKSYVYARQTAVEVALGPVFTARANDERSLHELNVMADLLTEVVLGVTRLRDRRPRLSPTSQEAAAHNRWCDEEREFADGWDRRTYSR